MISISIIKQAKRTLPLTLSAGIFSLAILPGQAQEKDSKGKIAQYGHSVHGEAFNEGPRQKAYLMRGIAKIAFPVTTKSEQAQQFFNQGVGQLHAFWYLEAERSFRQAALLDPEMPMAYWGMARANRPNEDRAKGFIAEAEKLRYKATPKERLYIDALSDFVNADSKLKDRDKVREKAYVVALEKISAKYPNDIEAKAFYTLELWSSKEHFPERKTADIDKLMREVLAVQPDHPIFHYIIHLWNYQDDKKALDAAAKSGPSEPGSAHMWHMAGHTYTVLKRYSDAAYYQEASARVDHAQQMRDRLLPDQIHNYAHNNQWLVETLEFVGRPKAALDLARNMVELPRHPKYNTITGSGSSQSGRSRLLETLLRYELWKEARALDAQGCLEPTGESHAQNERLRLLAVASFATGDKTGGQNYVTELEKRLVPKPVPEKKGEKKEEPKIEDESFLKGAIAEARTYEALSRGDKAEAEKQLAAAKVSKDREARLWLQIGKADKAVEAAKSAATSSAGQVVPKATLVSALYGAGKKDEAKKEFETLRPLAASAELDTPLLAALAPAAAEFGYSPDWRTTPPAPSDIGKRPKLDTLGPFRWSPLPAPNFALKDTNGVKYALETYRKLNKPVVVLFILGGGCVQCLKQLENFVPLYNEYEKAGLSLLVVSPDEPARMRQFTVKDGKARYPFPILCDTSFRTYKAFRAYDDFEDMALHGLFLIDGKGQVRWQDISFQPFMDAGFLLEEAKRLLNQSPASGLTIAQK